MVQPQRRLSPHSLSSELTSDTQKVSKSIELTGVIDYQLHAALLPRSLTGSRAQAQVVRAMGDVLATHFVLWPMVTRADRA
jgi:hypothetical protein